MFVCFCSGPATDDKHICDCLFVVSTINLLLGPGRTLCICIFSISLFVFVYPSCSSFMSFSLRIRLHFVPHGSPRSLLLLLPQPDVPHPGHPRHRPDGQPHVLPRRPLPLHVLQVPSPRNPSIQFGVKLGQGSQPDHCNNLGHHPQDLRAQLVHHSCEPKIPLP